MYNKFFFENLSVTEMGKTQKKLLILKLSKIVMCEFWYGYVKPEYGKIAKSCYIYTDSFIVYIKTDDIYRGIYKRCWNKVFHIFKYELNWALPKGKNKKVIGLMKDKLGGKTMKKLAALRAKTYNYLIDDGSEDIKAKGNLKKQFKFKHYNICLDTTHLENKISHLKK